MQSSKDKHMWWEQMVVKNTTTKRKISDNSSLKFEWTLSVVVVYTIQPYCSKLAYQVE